MIKIFISDKFRCFHKHSLRTSQKEFYLPSLLKAVLSQRSWKLIITNKILY